MPTPNNKNWSEFEWERELRKDDERINSYMNELSKFIDLPGEEDIILKSLQSHSKAVPQNINFSPESESGLDGSEVYENEIFSNDEWRKKDNAIIYTIVEKMSSQWSMFLASRLVPENMLQGMRILCYYGKLLARISDILGVDLELPQALRIALCKRVTTIVNELLGELEKINEFQNDLVKEIQTHSKRLQIIREKIIDLLEKIRKENT